MSDIDLNQILQAAIPQWNQASFLFLEQEPWWAPSVQTQLARSDMSPIQARFGSTAPTTNAVTEFRCHSLPTTRAIHSRIQTDPATGIILIVDRQMRDCLLFLGRLSRLCRSHPPVLLIIPQNAGSLMPMLMESGAAAVMTDSVTDLRIADWCRRVAGSSQRNTR